MEIEDLEKTEEYINDAFQDIVNILRVSPQGISQPKLFEGLKQHNRKHLAEALNILFDENKIIIENSLSDQPLLKLLTEKEVLKLKDLTGEEHRVYEIVIGYGNNGITLNELKNQIGITGNALQKIRKRLEKKLLIKNFPVPNTKKKVIMGYEIEPSEELRGGFWCTNQQFDQNKIDVISNKCIDYLYKQKSATRKEILLYIKSTGLVNSDIKEENLQKILNILVFDDKLDLCSNDSIVYNSGNKYSVLLKKQDPILNLIKYKVSYDYYEDFYVLENSPCSYCPVFQDCKISNLINPNNCPHLESYFNEIM